MQITVRADTKKLTKHLWGIQRKQIPFATSVALNNVGKDVIKGESKEMKKVFDRPKPFTSGPRAMYMKRSNKRNLVTTVGLKDIQAEYLKHQIVGGTRRPKRKAIAIPTQRIKLNRYGNMARKKINQMLSQPHLYRSMEINGTAGIWRVYKRAPPKLMVMWKKAARYKPIFNFQKTAEKTIKRVYRRRFNIALTKALRTARQ